MTNRKRIEISRFDNFDKDGVKTESFYNYIATDKLENSKGVELAKFPLSAEDPTEYSLSLDSFSATSIDGLAFFKQYFNYSSVTSYRLILYDNAKHVYINHLIDDENSASSFYNLTFNTPPMTLAFKQNDTDSIIFADDQKMLIWKTMNTPQEIQNAPIITSMCSSGSVLFCTILDPAFKIWYTTDLDAENIGDIGKQSNYISLEDGLGDAKKVLVYDRNVYVIREFGISKISFIKNEVVVGEVYKSNTRILHNTVEVCGNLMWFMTKTGLFSFNGIKVFRSEFDISKMLSGFNDSATSASLGNDYYLALKLDFGDGNEVLCENNNNHINNALLILDTTNGRYQIIRGVDIKQLLAVKTPVFEKMLCVLNSDNKASIGQICNSSKSFSSYLPKSWKSRNIFPNHDCKILTSLTVDAESGVSFKLVYGNKFKTFTTSKNGFNEFFFKIYCNDLKIEISSTGESAKVNKVYLDYYEK